ncbi:MAG: hypothetical protein M3N28_08155 [Actinomycetota bacterium]|nr:hypothetical protein [Actinomycetota bacterium]
MDELGRVAGLVVTGRNQQTRAQGVLRAWRYPEGKAPPLVGGLVDQPLMGDGHQQSLTVLLVRAQVGDPVVEDERWLVDVGKAPPCPTPEMEVDSSYLLVGVLRHVVDGQVVAEQALRPGKELVQRNPERALLIAWNRPRTQERRAALTLDGDVGGELGR